MASSNGTSNFRTAHKPDLEHWKIVPYPEYNYVEVSDFGRVRDRRTGNVYSQFKTNNLSKSTYVTLSPAKGIPGVKRSIAVSRLVFEAFNAVLLPRGTLPVHLNGDETDNRLVNLEIPAGVTFGTIPETKPFSPETPPVKATISREQEFAKRYAERMEHLRVAISCCGDWRTVEDMERIGILESEWLYALEEMPVEQVVVLVLKLIELARGDA